VHAATIRARPRDAGHLPHGRFGVAQVSDEELGQQHVETGIRER
jgi:hypothetical protein